VDGKGGGVKLTKLTTSRRDFRSNHRMQLITPQTLKEKKVHKVLIAEDVYYPEKVKL
jgi:hypothetical protein